MIKKEFYDKLDAEQKKVLNTLTTAEEVLSFAKKLEIGLDAQAAAEIAGELPDEFLEDVSGGFATRMGKKTQYD